jgi:response regulator RpfG family c-di-GMP phosphodiesterase
MIRLLFVDDDPAIRRLFQRLFTQPTYEVDVADGGGSALQLLEDNDYDAVISDFRMPRMDGGEFLARACDRRPHAARILVTASSDFDVAVQAVNRGEVFRVVRKPWDDDDLHSAIGLAVQMRNLRRESEKILRVLNEKTESLGRINAELESINQRLESQLQARTRAIVATMVSALEYRDAEASARARRIAAYARRLGEEMHLTQDALWSLEQGSLLHDIGKLGVPDAILFKRGPLDEGEWAALRLHPVIGCRMLQTIEFLGEARRLVAHHRESWDGGGYPGGVAGEAIALGARIFAVAEVLNGVLGDAHYAAITGYVVARAELLRGAGHRFDPSVVEAFLSVPSREWLAMRQDLGGEAVLLEVA